MIQEWLRLEEKLRGANGKYSFLDKSMKIKANFYQIMSNITRFINLFEKEFNKKIC